MEIFKETKNHAKNFKAKDKLQKNYNRTDKGTKLVKEKFLQSAFYSAVEIFQEGNELSR